MLVIDYFCIPFGVLNSFTHTGKLSIESPSLNILPSWHQITKRTENDSHNMLFHAKILLSTRVKEHWSCALVKTKMRNDSILPMSDRDLVCSVMYVLYVIPGMWLLLRMTVCWVKHVNRQPYNTLHTSKRHTVRNFS